MNHCKAEMQEKHVDNILFPHRAAGFGKNPIVKLNRWIFAELGLQAVLHNSQKTALFSKSTRRTQLLASFLYQRIPVASRILPSEDIRKK